MYQPTTHIFFKTLCGEETFLIWDESHHNFGLCFQKLLMCGISYSSLAIFSAFYAGKKTSLFVRSRAQNILIIIRMLITLLCLFLAVSQPCFLKLYTPLKIFWVDIFTASVQAFSWLVHLKYLSSLRHYLSRGTRGPRPVIGAWILTLICSISSCKTAWSINDHHFQDNHIEKFTLDLLRWLVTSQLSLQVLYLITLFPRGRCDEDVFRRYSQINSRTPSDSHFEDNGRFHESFDPLHLGVAEEGVNTLSYLTFHWVNLLMKKGSSLRGLESVDDLHDLPHSLRSENVSQLVQKQLLLSQPLSSSGEDVEEEEEEDVTPDHLFLRAIYRCFGLRFLSIGVLKFMSDCLSFASPLLLNVVVRFVEGKENVGALKGYGAGIGLCLTTLLSAFCFVYFNYYIGKLNIQLRAALVTSLFRKIQNLSLSHLSAFSTGEVVNLMTTDVDRVVNFSQSFHAFWSLPFQLGITLFLLYGQIGISFLSGIVFAILLIPINKLLASKIGSLSTSMMGFKDRRLDLMSGLLSKIKEVKLNSFEGLFKRKIFEERLGEVKALAGRKYLDAVCVFFWATTPVFIPIITFGTYAALGNPMDPAKIFTAVALFNMLITPLNAFPWVINGLVEAWVSMKRIGRLMQIKEYKYQEYYTLVPEKDYNTSEIQVVIDGSFSWNNSKCLQGEPSPTQRPGTSAAAVAELASTTLHSDLCGTEGASAPNFTLNGVGVTIKKSHVVAVIGNVGSGKTALLYAILGELDKVSGVIGVAGLHRGFGLATQKPWLQNISVKENIIFGHNFDPSRYRSVLHACCLEEDLKTLHKGEDTKCGENGASLSGGQRARIALARAVYQVKNIYLLDDIFSSVDGPVAMQIMDRCIHGLLAGRTVIMISSHLHLLGQVDWVIRMKEGRIEAQGPPSEILPKPEAEHLKQRESLPMSASGAVPRNTSRIRKKPSQMLKDLDPAFSVAEKVRVGEAERPDVESRSFGELSCAVFATYLWACGALVVTSVFVALLLMQASRNLVDIWLAKWVSHSVSPINGSALSSGMTEETIAEFFPLSSTFRFSHSVPQMFPSFFVTSSSFKDFFLKADDTTSTATQHLIQIDPASKSYLSVYVVLAAFNSLFTFLRAFLFAYGGIRAAKVLHKKLLDTVVYSKVSFFDLNPLGRILNRFSSDIYAVDDTLPFQANIFFAQLFGLLGAMFIAVYGLPWISLLFVPLLFIYYTVQNMYRHTSRDLRRLYAVSLSPLYTHFTDTLQGLPVIRAFRVNHRFSLFMDGFLEQNQRAQFSLMITSQWLNLRLQIIGVGILCGVVLLAFWEHHAKGVSPGLVGLVLSYCLIINVFLNGVITSLTESERELISVERIHQYLVGTTREGLDHLNAVWGLVSPPLALPYGWPNHGQIVFENVYLKYHEHNPYSLRNVSFAVAPSEKIGIVGRTGAGKSSLFMALFRMVELTRGKIFIDHVDIADLSIKKLRTSLAIVSQDVLLFSGTVRENLDPRGENLDREILSAVDQCHLSNVVANLGGLDASLNSGHALSGGEKQLFCLARALLSRSKIVCLDEGMALLDMETEARVQSVVREAFRNKTVLAIAHRMHSLRDCSRVVVLSEGEIAEIGRPVDLMDDANSLFHSMVYSQS